METLSALSTADADGLESFLRVAGAMGEAERLAALAGLLEADLWMAGRGRLGPRREGEEVELVHGARIALGEERLALALETHFHADAPKLAERVLGRAAHATRLRADLVPDLLWYFSPIYRKHRKPAGLDDFVLSLRRLDGERLEVVGLHRADGGASFGARERCILHVAASLAWGEAAARAHELGPVLARILGAESDERVREHLALEAEELDARLSDLRSLFSVGSRTELQSHCLRGGGHAS